MKNYIMALSLLSLSGCWFNTTSSREIKTINVKGGEDFKISLDVTAGTGYTWTISYYNPSGPVKIESKKTGDSDSGMLGAPTKEIFEFEVDDISHSATVYLTFNYHRPWEHGTKPEKTQDYKIVIN